MIVLTKKPITLIEMMIVMFLIAMIIGVVAYNYQGSLEEGKAFKTKTAMDKVSTILTVMSAENPNLEDDLEGHWKDYIKESPLVQNANALTKDGWGEDLIVRIENGKIQVSSNNYNNYLQNNKGSLFKQQ